MNYTINTRRFNNVKGVIIRKRTNNTVVQGENLLATNHFRLLYTPESCNRYSGVADSLQNNVNISPSRSWTILTDAAGVGWNLHGIQYNESARELKWATSTVSIPAYLQSPSVFDLDDLFYPETGVIEAISTTEQQFNLAQNYPNPFNPTTTIQYDIPIASQVTLTIYNMNGQVVERPVNQKQEPGFYSVNWDARNVSTGVYFYQIRAEGFQQVKKMLLIK